VGWKRRMRNLNTQIKRAEAGSQGRPFPCLLCVLVAAMTLALWCVACLGLFSLYVSWPPF
jgi:hypothetical protein